MVLGEDNPLLLTDDEVLFVALNRNASWPGMLPSVPVEAQARFRAALRGMRSLLIRGLAEPTGETITVDPEIESVLNVFFDGAVLCGAHPATPTDPDRFLGIGYLTALPAFGPGIRDVISPLGVHQFLHAPDDPVPSMVDTLEQIHGLDSGGANGGYLMYATGESPRSALWCGPERIVEGMLAEVSGKPGRWTLTDPTAIDLDRARAWISEHAA